MIRFHGKDGRTMEKLALVMIMIVCVAVPTFAEEAASPHSFSGNVTIATDYVFRGVSQTSENPAIQGGFDYGHASGFYAGVWASNIDFDMVDTAIEMDWYAGFANTIGGLEYDFMLIYYAYPGADDDDAELNFFEAHVGLSYGFDMTLSPTLGIGYDYSPDFFGEDDTGHHYTASLDLTLPMDVGLGGLYGYQDVEGDVTSPDGFDYSYWKIGLTKEILGFELDLSYWDTDEDDTDIASERIVFSVSRSL